MRLILTGAGRTLLDVEVLLWRKAGETPADDGPTLRANGGGQAERAETFGDPMTIAGFGFHATGRHPSAAPRGRHRGEK